LSFVAGLPIALYINIFRRRKSRFAAGVRLCLDILWGVPSIVYGAFGFTIMVFLGIKASLLMGTCIVALLVLPVVVRSIDEIIQLVPEGLLEASYSLGATRTQTAFRIVVRQILPVWLPRCLSHLDGRLAMPRRIVYSGIPTGFRSRRSGQWQHCRWQFSFNSALPFRKCRSGLMPRR
jgi:ABC-type amino acid transport system permease subunit